MASLEHALTQLYKLGETIKTRDWGPVLKCYNELERLLVSQLADKVRAEQETAVEWYRTHPNAVRNWDAFLESWEQWEIDNADI